MSSANLSDYAKQVLGAHGWSPEEIANLDRFPTQAAQIDAMCHNGEFRRPVSRALPPGFIASAPKERLGRRIGVPTGRQIGDFGDRDSKDRGDLGGRLRRDQPLKPRGDAGEVRDRGSVRRGAERPVPSREAPRPALPGGRRERDESPGPDRIERRQSPPPPPPAPKSEPEVERAPRNDPPPKTPESQRSPRPQTERNEGGIRGRR